MQEKKDVESVIEDYRAKKTKEYQKKYHEEHREGRLEYFKKQYRKNPEKYAERNRRNREKKKALLDSRQSNEK